MGRAPCCEKVGLKRGKWTADEDEKLIKYIASKGVASWRSLPKLAGLLRCGKSCRLRWMNYLRADLKRGNITKEEDEIILNLHETLGNRWSVIAGHLPGRTDNEIKNHWNTHLKKRAQSFRRSDKENKERTTTSNKVSSDDSGSDRLITKKSSNNASVKKVKNSKGDDRPTPSVQSEESNTITDRHQFSCVATASGERLQCSNHTSPIMSDIEMSSLDFQRCTMTSESEVAPSFSCATTSHSEHRIISSISNGPDQELPERETFGLCQELWSPISLVGDCLASGVTSSGGEREGGALQLNESGLVDQQGWAMGDQGEVWDWDLEDIEDKLWGEEGEMWSWIREQ